MRKHLLIGMTICTIIASSLLSGCTNTPNEPIPFSIVSFDVNPDSIDRGETANLSWAVQGATNVSIDHGVGIVALTGHRIIQPTVTTTYTLIATNATTTRNATVTITVRQPENETPEHQEILIASFIITPPIITQGEPATLTWVVTGATTVSIDQGIGSVSPIGSRVVTPTANTTYTLTASNGDDSATATTHIIVHGTKGASGTSVAIITTTLGIIRVELFADQVPNTCQNFIKLARDGFYNGLVFHRVIDDFMIQGGGYYPDGTQKTDPYGPIDLEINPDVHHVDGAIAMARTSDPNSATCQFFIDDGAQPQLEPGGVDQNGYTVFGVVIGSDSFTVLRNIAAVQTTTRYGMADWPVNDVIIMSITIENP